MRWINGEMYRVTFFGNTIFCGYSDDRSGFAVLQPRIVVAGFRLGIGRFIVQPCKLSISIAMRERDLYAVCGSGLLHLRLG